MFTGIVTDVGTLDSVRRTERDARLRIRTGLDLSDVAIGASIACAGCCLTVVARDAAAGWFDADVSAETMSKTTLGDWREGRRINLERSLKLGDELGGHIVSGHVDGVATVHAIEADGESLRVTLAAPRALAAYLAPKGSVALDGASLTVNEVEDVPDAVHFTVNLIPHTRAETSFDALEPGTRLNLEVDTLARYVARIAQTRAV